MHLHSLRSLNCSLLRNVMMETLQLSLQDPSSQTAPLAGDNLCTASPGNPSACQCPLLLSVSYVQCKYYYSCLLSTALSLVQQGIPA